MKYCMSREHFWQTERGQQTNIVGPTFSVYGLASTNVQFQSAILKFRDLNQLEHVFLFSQVLIQIEET